ncbi:tlde1 domain-containing protein [Rosenbergiella australiborealis]|uniref:tlde1 domain-containing protein n=1 Tax=Rosenbergiella australiborealis TaxID=1544696 RepID=UPI001F4DF97B|nr:tlde1 domain-containing protein [Rosenbergiella australiborealis]
MPWIYQQSTGRLYHNQRFIEQGYSGYPPHTNSGQSQHLADLGPIPIGDYTLGATTLSRGPLTLILQPATLNRMFGRHSFRIHGESSKKPGYASQGCIILSNTTRKVLANSADRQLQVVR